MTPRYQVAKWSALLALVAGLVWKVIEIVCGLMARV